MSNVAFVNKVGRADWIVVLDQVRKNLPSTFSVAKQMHLTPPLQIDADVKDKDASSYKVPCLCCTVFVGFNPFWVLPLQSTKCFLVAPVALKVCKFRQLGTRRPLQPR